MLILRLLSYLPFAALYAFADFLRYVLMYVIKYRRKIVRRNLKNSFPDKSNDELSKIERQFYQNLCDYGVETLKLLTMKREDLARRMTFKNIELIEHYKHQNQSVLILAGHQFNWEWLLTAGNFSLPLPVEFVYQKVSSGLFNTFSLTCRTRFGAFPIERERVARETLRRTGIQRCVAILADQYPGHRGDKKHPAIFLNQDSVFFQGANQLAVLMQCPVVFAQVRRLRRGRYEAEFVPVSEPPYGKADVGLIHKYVKVLEAAIVKQPSNWLWSHDRWKKRHLNKSAQRA
jgi:Kdo2-lipid IVA lauroyltransferase/acyltransferase